MLSSADDACSGCSSNNDDNKVAFPSLLLLPRAIGEWTRAQSDVRGTVQFVREFVIVVLLVQKDSSSCFGIGGFVVEVW